MTREDKLNLIAQGLDENEEIVVKVRHKGDYDGCHCYVLQKNKIVKYFHAWNCQANFMEMYRKYYLNKKKVL